MQHMDVGVHLSMFRLRTFLNDLIIKTVLLSLELNDWMWVFHLRLCKISIPKNFSFDE
jgi:hypothetical protein